MASEKRTNLFLSFQPTETTDVAERRPWNLILDGGIRWNASFSMILRALDMYAAQLRGSRDDLDQEPYNQDHISDDEWQTLCIIKEQLERSY
jgi:hypothetical protein